MGRFVSSGCAFLLLLVAIAPGFVVRAQDEQQQPSDAPTPQPLPDVCQLCPAGSEMGAPDNPFYDGQLPSCGAIDASLSQVPPQACGAALEQFLSQPVDFRSYCRCTGYAGSGVECSLCEEGETLINVDESQPLLGGYTCGEFQALASSAQDATVCFGFTASSGLCCQEDAPSAAPAAGGPDTTTSPAASAAPAAPGATAVPTVPVGTDTCQICFAQGDMMTLPDRELFWATLGGDIPTCATFDAFLQAREPDACRSILQGETVDLTTWCGCPGATSPNVCVDGVCGAGQVLNPENADSDVSFAGRRMTCEQVDTYNQFISEADQCAINNQEVADTCCTSTSAPTGPVVPTSAPSTPVPVAPTISPAPVAPTTSPTTTAPAVPTTAPAGGTPTVAPAVPTPTIAPVASSPVSTPAPTQDSGATAHSLLSKGVVIVATVVCVAVQQVLLL